MDYTRYLLLLSFGALLTVAEDEISCSDQSAIQKCLKNLQQFEKSLNFFTNKGHLESDCGLFNESMQCLDRYLEKCIEVTQRENIDKKLTDTRNAVKNLCNNPRLKEDLLYNKECYEMVSDDWKTCLKTFQVSDKPGDVCAVRDTVIKCGFDSAKSHCSVAAAASVCKMSMSLMGMVVPGSTCKTDGLELCSAGFSVQPTLLLLLITIALGIKNLR